MSRAIHRAKNGTQYVYESTSYWDKKKKAPRTKQVYLGKLDPNTNELIPKRVAPEKALELLQPSIQTIGATIILDHAADKTGLASILKKVFPEAWTEILTLAYFICHSGSALSHCETWAQDHRNPAGIELNSQNISRFMKQIDETSRTQFLAAWAARFSEKEMLCYDITSISSYAQSMNFVRYGYNRDHEKLPQINLAMLYGQQSRLPVHYRRLPGNISDVSTLGKTMQLLNYANRNHLCLVMDMGFYSQKNLDELYERHYNFLMAVPSTRKWIADIIEEQWVKLNSAAGFKLDGEKSLYVASKLTKHNGHRCYVHLFYNEAKKAQDNDEFMRRFALYRENLQNSGAEIERNEFLERFLEISDTPKRGMKITYRDEVIRQYRERHTGIFVLITNHIKDAMEALRDYREKDIIEKSFDDLKNEEDCKRLRMHSDQAADCKLFLGFLALILRSFIANGIRDHAELERLGIPRLMRELNTLREVREKNRYRSVVTEPTKIQRAVLEAFSINLPSAKFTNLRNSGYKVNHKRVRRLQKSLGLSDGLSPAAFQYIRAASGA